MIRLCCFMDSDLKRCENLAEWEIWEIDYLGKCTLDNFTDSCTEHVGLMLSDKPEHRIFPIQGMNK